MILILIGRELRTFFIHIMDLKFSVCIFNVLSEGSVSQISDLGLVFIFEYLFKDRDL